jgi:hypothetical protein
MRRGLAPYLDLMLALEVSRERYSSAENPWEVIPFFHAVYHPYAVIYGNYSSLVMPPYDELWPAEFAPAEPLALLDRKYSRQFYLEQARTFVWGQQPTLANFRPALLEQRAEEIDYIARLARVRSRSIKYLLHGEFLRPPELSVPQVTADFSRLSIYAGQKSRLTSSRKSIPLALAGAWRAADGDVALALASLADETLSLSFTIDRQYYGLPQQPRGPPHRRARPRADRAANRRGRSARIETAPARSLDDRVFESVVEWSGAGHRHASLVAENASGAGKVE